MPRWPKKGPNKGKKWSAEHRRHYMATIRAKRAAATPQARTVNALDGLSVINPIFNPAFTDVLDKQIERLQKVRDLLR